MESLSNGNRVNIFLTFLEEGYFLSQTSAYSLDE